MFTITESNIFFMLLQLVIILILTKYFGSLLKKRNQPTITSDILVGIFLGPTILGRFFPRLHDAIFPQDIVQLTMMETLGWFGLFLVLLSTGIEVDISSIWKQRKKAAFISFTDITIPIVFSMAFIYFLPESYFIQGQSKFVISLFIATIMTISALPISIRTLRDLGILKSDLGFLIVSVLTINDIIGWIIFTLILSLFSMQQIDLGIAFKIITGTILFTFLALKYGKVVIDKLFSKSLLQKEDGIQWILSIVVITGTLFGLITLEIGIHSLFGFFIAGIIAGDSKEFSKSARNTIHNFVYSVFVSLFFVNIGLKIDFFNNFNLFLSLFITVVGIAGRYLGAWVGGTFSSIEKRNLQILSVAHTPGGEMHIVVSLLALELGLLNETLFVSIVFGAILSSITTGPWLAFIMNKMGKLKNLKIQIYPGIFLEADTKEDAIKKLLANVGFDGQENEIKSIVLKREDDFCTGMLNNIAVPQGRIKGLSTPLVIFARLKAGVDWNSLDGKLSKNIFLVLVPLKDDTTQIEILEKISTLAKECPALEKFNQMKNPEDIEKYLHTLFTSDLAG